MRGILYNFGDDRKKADQGTSVVHQYDEKGCLHMQITDVRVRKIEKEGKMKDIVSITFDNEFVIHDIKVIEGEKGLFIAMPSRKTPTGEYRDIAHPINTETREIFTSAILDAYNKAEDKE